MKKLGKYEISSILGKGAMGIVYKAIDPDINRKVAIKTIRFDLVTEGSDSEEMMQRFMREAQAAGKLSHPNIITIYDVGREQDLTYIVMQFIEGPSLQRIIASGEKFTTQEVVFLMTKMCSALAYAHKFGIVHRDIKPGNILIDNDGNPYICDFGVARVETSTLTQSGTAVGTPSYMSPEQVKGKKVDKRSDIFALGCILYEFLTGKRPFEAESITTVIYKIINEEPPSLAEVKKGLPEGFEHIIGKALAKDPEERYQSCEQLAADLRDLDKLAEKTIAITTPEAVPPPVKKRKKRRLVPILAISLTTIILIAAGGGFYFYKKTGKVPFISKIPFISIGTQGTKGEDIISTYQIVDAVPGSIDDKLNKAKESFDIGDYSGTVKLAEEVLSEDSDNSTAKSFLNSAQSKMNELLVAQVPAKKEAKVTEKSSPVKPKAPSSIEAKLIKAKQSYENGDYAETVKLAEEVLAVNAGNLRAKDYLNNAKTKINEAALITKTLTTGINLYDNKNYELCKREMNKILEINMDHKEAKKYWNLADNAIYEAGARREIQRVIEHQKKAEEEKDILSLLSDIGSSALSSQKKSDIIPVFNYYDNIKWSSISIVSFKLKDRSHVEVSFSYMSTAVSKRTGQKATIFGDIKTWTMEKQGNSWKIISERLGK